MSNSVKYFRLSLLFAGILFSSAVFGAGFEKSLTWSAKSAAQGGAVVGSTAGAEALYFNPAGLAESSTSGEISANFSPTLSRFTGTNPFSKAGSIKGSNGFSPVFGVLASFKPMPKLGLGIGYYVSGGTKAKFENLDYSSYPNFDTLKPTVETNLSITELALGAGYELAPGFRVGLAWRLVMVNANFSTVKTDGTTLQEIDIENIKATRANAFKLGMQYEEPNHRWGLGASFRSSVSFTATGDSTLKQETAPGSFATFDTGPSNLTNTFPLQIALGGWTRATELLRIGYEYSFTHYTDDHGLEISNAVTGNATITQNWKNMHIVRLGGEYTGMGLPLRFGYAYTSQVTPNDRARSTFASPGPGHALAFGTGMIVGNGIDVDGALEYSFAGGTGHNNSGEVLTDSDFKSHAYAAHLSAKYHF